MFHLMYSTHLMYSAHFMHGCIVLYIIIVMDHSNNDRKPTAATGNIKIYLTHMDQFWSFLSI